MYKCSDLSIFSVFYLLKCHINFLAFIPEPHPVRPTHMNPCLDVLVVSRWGQESALVSTKPNIHLCLNLTHNHAGVDQVHCVPSSEFKDMMHVMESNSGAISKSSGHNGQLMNVVNYCYTSG